MRAVAENAENLKLHFTFSNSFIITILWMFFRIPAAIIEIFSVNSTEEHDKSEVVERQNLSERGTLVPQIRSGLIHKRD